jgi:hypothetical protein
VNIEETVDDAARRFAKRVIELQNRVGELELRRDAAVAILRAAKGPQLVPAAWSRTAQLDVGVSEALAALGAEETT